MDKLLLKFLIVGGVNTLFSYTLFSLLIYMGLHYTVAVLISTVLGVLFNFQTTGKIVFGSHNNTLIWKFFAVYGILYICNIIGLYFLEKLSVDIYLAGAMLILPLALLSFALNKKYVFRR